MARDAGAGSVKRLLTVMMMACALSANAASATAATPVLIELFTSEGCSSCPPADALLQRWDASQPLPGVNLIVLSEHVDYWNRDGWKDPYSSSSMTDRQVAYVRALRLKTPYTPQFIVDGSHELEINNLAEMRDVLEKASAQQKLSVRIGSVSVEGTRPPVLRGRIEIDGNADKRSGDVFLAVALNHAESQVLAGENSGQHLTYVAVVEDLKKIGSLDKDLTFSHDFQVKLKPGTDPTNIRIIALVQESGSGAVIGAALRENIN
jgi:hypothetical protein